MSEFIVDMYSEELSCNCDICNCNDECHCNCDCNCNCDCYGNGGCYCITD